MELIAKVKIQGVDKVTHRVKELTDKNFKFVEEGGKLVRVDADEFVAYPGDKFVLENEKQIKKLIDRKFAEPVEGGFVVTEEVTEKPVTKRKSKKIESDDVDDI